jgi:hypothetical protein
MPGSQIFRISNLRQTGNPLYRESYKNRGYNPVVPLSIYRRHSVDCRVHTLKLSASEKKFFTDCDCPIWLTGTTDSERYPRQALGVRDWRRRNQSSDLSTRPARTRRFMGRSLEDCITRYLDARET